MKEGKVQNKHAAEDSTSDDTLLSRGSTGFQSNTTDDPGKVQTVSAILAVLIVVVMIKPLYQIALSIIYFDTNAELLMLKPSLFGNILGLIGNISGNVISMLPWLLLIFLMAALIMKPARNTLFKFVKWISFGGVIFTVGLIFTTYITKICHTFISVENEILYVNWMGLVLYVLMLSSGAAAILFFYFIARDMEKSLSKGGLQVG